MTVIRISYFTNAVTGIRIIFRATKLTFVNTFRANTSSIFSATFVTGSRLRISTVIAIILVFRLTNTRLIFSATFCTLAIFFSRTSLQIRIASTRYIHPVTTIADADLSSRAANQPRITFTSAAISRVIRTNTINCLNGVTALWRKTLIQALRCCIKIKGLISAATSGARRRVKACTRGTITNTQETNTCGLISLIKLSKFKGGLQFGCVR